MERAALPYRLGPSPQPPVPCPLPLAPVPGFLTDPSRCRCKDTPAAASCAARPCLPPLPPTASPMRCRSRTPRIAWASPLGLWQEPGPAGVSLPLPLRVCDCVTHQARPESDPRAMGATSVAHRRRRTRADRGTRPRDASEGWGGEEPARGVRAPSFSGGRSRRRPSPFHAVQSVYSSTVGRIPTILALVGMLHSYFYSATLSAWRHAPRCDLRADLGPSRGRGD